MTPSQLLATARALLDEHAAATKGSWPRAVAFIARQALELSMANLWQSRRFEMEGISAHAQLLCLGAYVTDPRIGADARYAWWALSRACHHHPYELAPTVTELRRWLDIVDRLVASISMSAGVPVPTEP